MSNSSNWSPLECEVLCAHYPTATQATLLELLPDRTWRGIVRHATALKVRRTLRANGWPVADLQTLRKLYPTKGSAATMDALPQYSYAAIRRQACGLGLKVARVPRTRPTAKQVAKDARREARAKKLLGPKPAKVVALKPAKPARPAPVAKALPLPGVQDNARTPRLNALKAERQRETAEQEKATDWLHDMKKLDGNHPARIAFTIASRQGLAAGKAAYFTTLNTLKQAA